VTVGEGRAPCFGLPQEGEEARGEGTHKGCPYRREVPVRAGVASVVCRAAVCCRMAAWVREL